MHNFTFFNDSKAERKLVGTYFKNERLPKILLNTNPEDTGQFIAGWEDIFSLSRKQANGLYS
jgi:hypothetical protein